MKLKEETKTEHVPIMLEEVLELLPEKEGSTVVDCTLGTGSHTFVILEKLKKSTVLAMDLDEDQIDYVFDKASRKGFIADKEQSKEFWGWKLIDRRDNTLYAIKSNYMYLTDICKKLKIKSAGLVLFDLGFSTFQLEQSKRGFSYTGDEEFLDQRYDATQGLRGIDVVNKLSKKDLASALEQFGEERFADEIAEAIVTARNEAPIETNTQLIQIVRETVGRKYERGKHPAMRTFQALRIAVNNELVSLATALPQALSLIAGVKNSSIALITFNSLERKVIEKFVEENRDAVLKDQVKASISEVAQNPKAHNAILYLVKKLQ